MDRNKLAKYAELIAKVGINVQEKDGIILTASMENMDLVRELVTFLYKSGVKNIVTRFNDDELTLARYKNGHDYIFETYPEFEVDYQEAMLKDNYHRIVISAPNPDLMKNVDVDRQKKFQRASLNATERLQKYMDSGEVKWVVAAAATKAWAKKVFPELSEEEAMDKLWENIFLATRMNLPDPIKAWEEHAKVLKDREIWLDNQQFEKLHYSAPGTDLEVYLSENHKWIGGPSETPNKIKYMANIPTEEVFTTPHARKVNGKLKATKPLSVMGNLVEDMSFVFKDGEVVEFKASKNQEILESMMAMDEGAKRLGEVALVPNMSPINQTGILFSNTLFDENASCHFALGNAYAETTINGENLSEEERKELGANKSMIHIDFMVGSENLNVVGYKKDGTKVDVLINGEWAN